jgi:hypothetical protein
MNAAASIASDAQGRARVHAQDLTVTLDRAQALACNIDHVLYLGLAHARARGLLGGVERARGLARQLAAHLGKVGALASDLDADLTRGATRAFRLTGDLKRDLDAASDIADRLYTAVVGARAGRLARAIFTRDLRPALFRAGQQVGAVWFALNRGTMRSAARPLSDRAVTSAERLVVVAVQLLPVADRPRYLEEFQSELGDLARAGARRRQQRCYAFRQVSRAAGVRAALVDPRRKRARP